MLLEDIVDLKAKRIQKRLGSAITKSTQWPTDAHPMTPSVERKPGIWVSLWILSTQEHKWVLGPFKSVEQSIAAAKKKMDPEELQDIEDHEPDFFKPAKMELRRPQGQPLQGLEFGTEEAIFVITKNFVPTQDMVFSHESTRAFSPGKEVLKLQDQIAAIQGQIDSGNNSSFLQKRLHSLQAELETHRR